MKPGDSFNGKRIRAITPFAGNTYKLVFDDGSHGYANITDQIGQGSAAQPKEGLPEQDFEIDNYMKSKAIPVDDRGIPFDEKLARDQRFRAYSEDMSNIDESDDAQFSEMRAKYPDMLKEMAGGDVRVEGYMQLPKKKGI